MNIQHRHRRWTFSSQYSEDYETLLTDLQQTVLLPLVDDFGNPILDPFNGAEILLPINVSTLTDEVFINRRLTGSAGYALRRGNRYRCGFFRVTGNTSFLRTMNGSTRRYSELADILFRTRCPAGLISRGKTTSFPVRPAATLSNLCYAVPVLSTWSYRSVQTCATIIRGAMQVEATRFGSTAKIQSPVRSTSRFSLAPCTKNSII